MFSFTSDVIMGKKLEFYWIFKNLIDLIWDCVPITMVEVEEDPGDLQIFKSVLH